MYINLNCLDTDDKIFASKIEDMFILCDKNKSIKFSNFLDERQKAIAAQISGKYKNINYCFFSGVTGCERAVMCVFSQDVDQTDIIPPIKIIEFNYRMQDKLSHRDVLGALMALKIKRETIGDIFVDEGTAVIVCTNIVSEIIINEIKTIGKVGVECFYQDNPIINCDKKFLEQSSVVSSLRLDCIISAITSLSREKSLNLIKNGLITHNYQIASVSHKDVKLNDKLTIRGYGKFIISDIVGQTRKNKIRFIYKKYL